MKLNENKIQKIIRQVIKESLAEYENVECFNILNDDFDGDWRSILTANLYDKNNNCVGKLKDMHFVYDVENNKLEGSW